MCSNTYKGAFNTLAANYEVTRRLRYLLACQLRVISFMLFNNIYDLEIEFLVQVKIKFSKNCRGTQSVKVRND